MIADVPQTVTFQRVVDIASATSGLAVRHQLHGRSHRVRCTFAEQVSKTRARGPITCTVRVYRTVDGHRFIGERIMGVEVIARRHAFIRRDGTGFATYSSNRSLGFYHSPSEGA